MKNLLVKILFVVVGLVIGGSADFPGWQAFF